jgi:hypothetical protein
MRGDTRCYETAPEGAKRDFSRAIHQQLSSVRARSVSIRSLARALDLIERDGRTEGAGTLRYVTYVRMYSSDSVGLDITRACRPAGGQLGRHAAVLARHAQRAARAELRRRLCRRRPSLSVQSCCRLSAVFARQPRRGARLPYSSSLRRRGGGAARYGAAQQRAYATLGQERTSLPFRSGTTRRWRVRRSSVGCARSL